MIAISSPCRRLLLCSALVCPFAGRAGEPLTFTPPSRLTAVMADRDVELSWQHTATADGGCWIEFSTPGDDYTKLDFAWPETTTFRHPHVMPETKFIYRVVPFFGKPSTETEIATGTAVPGTIEREEEGPLPNLKSDAVVKKASIRTAGSFAEAMADGLTAKLTHPTTVELRWNDHATDEDGFLLEIAAAGDPVFRPCALLPRDTTSFRKIQLPSGVNYRFRVRAFFYGEASKPVSILTPPAPPLKKD